MKKFLTLAVLSLSSIGFASSAEAKTGGSTTAAVSAAPQIIIRTPRQRRARVVTTTRNVRRGRFLYRETYRTTYRPNGAVVRRLVSSVVIRRY